MSISSTVASLSNVVAAHVESGDLELRERLAQLAKMPAFVANARLDRWEQELLPARELASRSDAHAAMVAILELGRINLYSDIDETLTAEYLETALDAVRKTGAKLDENAELDVSDW